jgi:hypothetical protein
MAETLTMVAYLAPDRAAAEKALAALEAEGIAATLEPAGSGAGYHGVGEGRVEVRVSGEVASRARLLALEAVGD